VRKITYLFLLFFIFSANANAFSCKGDVLSIGLGPTNGLLQVDAGYGIHYLCKLNEEFNGVDPETCKAWYSMFLTAQASARAIEQYYRDGNGLSCSNLGSWAIPNPMPYYVVIN
jgi:hypothetical protein